MGQESAAGRIIRVNFENRKFVLKPKEGDRLSIRFNPERLKTTLDSQGARPEDIREGQLAEVSYMLKGNKAIARSVQLQSPPEMQTVSGRIVTVDIEKRRFMLRSEGEGPLSLRFNPERLKTTLGSQEAKSEDIREGQLAEVGYVLKDDKAIARSVQLQSQ